MDFAVYEFFWVNWDERVTERVKGSENNVQLNLQGDENARDVLKHPLGVLNVVNKARLPIKDEGGERFLEGKFIPGLLERAPDTEKLGLFNDAVKLLKKLNDIVHVRKESSFNKDRKLLRGRFDAGNVVRHIE